MTTLHAHPRDGSGPDPHPHRPGLHWVGVHHKPHRPRWQPQRALGGITLMVLGVLVMAGFHTSSCSSAPDASCDVSIPAPASGLGVALVVVGVLLLHAAIRARR